MLIYDQYGSVECICVYYRIIIKGEVGVDKKSKIKHSISKSRIRVLQELMCSDCFWDIQSSVANRDTRIRGIGSGCVDRICRANHILGRDRINFDINPSLGKVDQHVKHKCLLGTQYSKSESITSQYLITLYTLFGVRLLVTEPCAISEWCTHNQH